MTVPAVRNNNPGNIRIGEPWQGLMPRSQMSPAQAAETRFCVFMTPMWGFRAMAKIIHNYKVVSVGEVISHWAPTSENDTAAYIADVCGRLGIHPDAVFDFENSQSMADLCHAMSIHECGGWFFKEDDLIHGVLAAR